jgi:hypothetical protein
MVVKWRGDSRGKWQASRVSVTRHAGRRPCRDCVGSTAPNRNSPCPTRSGVLARGRERPAHHRRRDATAHSRARGPACLGGRLDLPAPERPHPGIGDRRARAQAVLLPRRMAATARPREVRPDGRARPAAPGNAPAYGAAGPGRKPTRERVLAGAIRLLDRGFFRIGGEDYVERTVRTASRRCASATFGSSRKTSSSSTTGERRQARSPVVVDPDLHRLVAELEQRCGGSDELLAYENGCRWQTSARRTSTST